MKLQFTLNLLVGAAINLAIQSADAAALSGKKLDLGELLTCAALAGVCPLLPRLARKAIKAVLANRMVTHGNLR